MNGLRVSVFISFALGSIVSQEPTAKISLFTDTFGSLSGGELREGDGIDVHGVRGGGGSRGQRLGGKGKSFSFQGEDAHFLCMKGLCLFNPFGNSTRNASHREDYGSKLLI